MGAYNRKLVQQTLDPFYAQICGLPIAIERGHHLVSGGQLSVGTGMDAYGDCTAAASTFFLQVYGGANNLQHRAVQLARSDRSH